MPTEYMKLPEQPYIKDSGVITTVYGAMIARVEIQALDDRMPLTAAFELYQFKDFGKKLPVFGNLVARYQTDIQHRPWDFKLREDTELSDAVAVAFAHSKNTFSDSSSSGLLFTPDQIVVLFGPLYDSARKESSEAWGEYTASKGKRTSKKG